MMGKQNRIIYGYSNCRKIIEERGNVCELHNGQSFCKYCDLEVHHIDGNRNNNHPDNLLVVCIIHHFVVDPKRRKIPYSKGRSKIFYRKRYDRIIANIEGREFSVEVKSW